MKIKALWGFIGNADKLKTKVVTVRRGDTFNDVDREYGMTLVGKGLAEEVGAKAAPDSDKQAKPSKPAKAHAGSDKQTKPSEAK